MLAAANVSLLGGIFLLGRAVADSVRTLPCALHTLRECKKQALTCCCAQGDLRVGLVLAAAIFMGYLYQGPPFRRAPLPMHELPLHAVTMQAEVSSATTRAQVELPRPGRAAVLSGVWAFCHMRLLFGPGTAACYVNGSCSKCHTDADVKNSCSKPLQSCLLDSALWCR